ncbi:IS5 family transposase [uncultured Selenomonas sp.]|uniref:IS5 family transposase n=1 Tax=uncultured Selenomonas sp. TaxID=159275 RepID=UPI0028E4FF34|nr:IS5 family transposase [uncultured Selenomonas sp.]
MYLLQNWFGLSDEGIEDAIYDSYAMKRFLKIDFSTEQPPDATTLLHFRHLLEKHNIARKMFDDVKQRLEASGLIMHGGTIVDATIIHVPSSSKDATKSRDPEMHSTKKGNPWYFGMKLHSGADAGTGYVHTITATAAPTCTTLSKPMR